MMGNDTRFGITMGAALLIWAPAGLGIFNGNVSFTAAAFRFAIAVALAYIGVSLVNRIIVRYGTANAVRDIQEAEARRVNGDVSIDLDR
jgi:hypothetical protein